MSRSLQQLLPVQRLVAGSRLAFYRKVWGMTIAPNVKVSLKANLDRTYPRGVRIGDWTWIAFGAVVLTHDRTRGIFTDTTIGENCFVGAHAIVMPGVTIGDNCVVGAGAVVVRDVPDRCIVAGNPARVIREGIEVGKYGRFLDADQVTYRLMAEGKYIQ